MGQSVISVLNRSACCQELLDSTLFTDRLVRGASFLCFEVVPSVPSAFLASWKEDWRIMRVTSPLR